MQYQNIFPENRVDIPMYFIGLEKRGYQVNIFLFLHENICCGYSLEAPHRGASNEYHNICFRGEIRKISILLGWKKSALARAMYLLTSETVR